MAELLLGVDGGGSKTRALVATRDGTILGAGTAGSSNYQVVGFAAARAALEQALAGALAQAAITQPVEIAAACFGLAGVDRPSDHALFEGWAAGLPIARRWSIVNDAQLVLAAGTPDGWGVALICGTGSICYARNSRGEEARSGGWGHLLGDEGSGYDLATGALRLATQTADGRAGAHPLLRAILDYWGLAVPEDLVGHVYGPEMTPREIAGLAVVVLRLAQQDDPAAEQLLNAAGVEWGRMVEAVVRRLELREPPVALAGGIFGAEPALRESVRRHAGVALGTLQYVDDPARGALVLAARLLESHDRT